MRAVCVRALSQELAGAETEDFQINTYFVLQISQKTLLTNN